MTVAAGRVAGWFYSARAWGFITRPSRNAARQFRCWSRSGWMVVVSLTVVVVIEVGRAGEFELALIMEWDGGAAVVAALRMISGGTGRERCSSRRPGSKSSRRCGC